MKKLTRFLILIAMAFALVFPFNQPQEVQASEIPPLSPGQTYDLYYPADDTEEKYTDPSLITFVSENPDVLEVTSTKSESVNDMRVFNEGRYFPVYFTITTKTTGDAKIDLYYDGKLAQENLLELNVRNYMWRMYNPNSGEHFYTSSDKEMDHLAGAGWKFEGTGWNAPDQGDPVYRLYNKNAGEHHYTTDEKEKSALVTAGWKDEGIGWYSDPDKAQPVYRQYNPNKFANNHNYTTSEKERDYLISIGWKDEGIAWYGVN